MTNEDVSEVVAGLKQGNSASHGLLVSQHGGVALGTGKCRTKKPVDIFSRLRAQVTSVCYSVQGRSIRRQPFQNVLAGLTRRCRSPAEQFEFCARRLLAAVGLLLINNSLVDLRHRPHPTWHDNRETTHTVFPRGIALHCALQNLAISF